MKKYICGQISKTILENLKNKRYKLHLRQNNMLALAENVNLLKKA